MAFRIEVNYPENSEEVTIMNVVEQNNRKYRVASYVRRGLTHYLPERDEEGGNIGTLTLPNGKDNLAELAEGDTLVFIPKDSNEDPNRVKFIRSV